MKTDNVPSVEVKTIEDDVLDEIIKEEARPNIIRLNFGNKPRIAGISISGVIFALATLASYLYLEGELDPYIKVVFEVLKK